MNKGNKKQQKPPIPQFIGGNRFRLDSNGSIMSKSYASSSIVGNGTDPHNEPPNPFLNGLGLDSSLSNSDLSLPSATFPKTTNVHQTPNHITETPLRMPPLSFMGTQDHPVNHHFLL